ncbi:MAG TPA: type II toxin-antitoxin system ParD family antitoxin [Humisphaera sp.]|jgi:antitoxin ParD1/3/4|nr:type II toxin-antitoxin system ParD family antitoxin [Humisphaera sp.]
MNIKLGPKFERFITQKVKSGEFLSSAEVIREALRLLEEKDQLRQFRLQGLRQQIEEGYRAIDAGHVTTYTKETLPNLLEKIQRQGRARLASSAKRAG